MEKKMNRKNKKGGALDHNLRCAANLEFIEGSCLSTNELKALALTYNKELQKNKIKGDEIKLTDNKKELIEELNNRFSKCNGDQLCWLKQKFVKDTKDFDPEDFFKPYGTDGAVEWLSDKNINDLMDQMQKKFSNFLFLGAPPIDFFKINFDGIAKIDFNDIMKNGYEKKNSMMVEYNLKKFYYDNILLCSEVNKFLNKKGLYELFNFKNDVKKYAANDFKKIMINFENQFISPKYDEQFIKSIKSKFKDNIADNFVNEIINILDKKYPIKILGMVPNLDTHDKGGSHWVSLFANLETGQIYFFDSYGSRPVKEIREYVKLIAEWKYKNDTGKVLNFNAENYMKKDNEKNEIEQKYDIRYNKTRNQFKGSECGVYSMNFIFRLLNGAKFDDIVSVAVPDDTINKCREIYFHNQDINSEKFEIVEGKGGRLKIKRGSGYICE